MCPHKRGYRFKSFFFLTLFYYCNNDPIRPIPSSSSPNKTVGGCSSEGGVSRVGCSIPLTNLHCSSKFIELPTRYDRCRPTLTCYSPKYHFAYIAFPTYRCRHTLTCYLPNVLLSETSVFRHPPRREGIRGGLPPLFVCLDSVLFPPTCKGSCTSTQAFLVSLG